MHHKKGMRFRTKKRWGGARSKARLSAPEGLTQVLAGRPGRVSPPRDSFQTSPSGTEEPVVTEKGDQFLNVLTSESAHRAGHSTKSTQKCDVRDVIAEGSTSQPRRRTVSDLFHFRRELLQSDTFVPVNFYANGRAFPTLKWAAWGWPAQPRQTCSLNVYSTLGTGQETKIKNHLRSLCLSQQK